MSKFLEPKARVLVSVVLSVLVYLVLPAEEKWETRLLLAWDVGVLSLLTLIGIMMARADPEQTYHRAQHQEPSSGIALVVCVLTSGIGMVAIAVSLEHAEVWAGSAIRLHTGIAIVAAFCGWLWIHTYFGLHYARKYYDEITQGAEGAFAKGLQFPDAEVVDYWDFLYYSFTIAMCFQTSDVTVTTPAMRRLTLVHSIVSFFFVTVVIGLVFNSIGNLL